MANNVKNLQNALKWLKHRIREEVKLDGCTSVDHAAELEFIQNVLEKFPLRQCDVGTAEEQYERYRHRCNAQDCCYCPVRKRWDFSRTGSESCQLVWAQMPYEEEGGADGVQSTP